MFLFLSRFKVPYCLIILLLLLIGNSSLIAKQFPVEADVLWERELINLAPVDFDGDSIDELVVILNDNVVQPFNQNLQALIATRILNSGTFRIGWSGCGGVDENNLWVCYFRNDSLFVYDLWPRREIFVTKGDDIDKPEGWDGAIREVELYDINADGRIEALVTVSVGFDLKPRGIFAFDWTTGKLLWKFLCGPIPQFILLKDIDGDEKTEILCGSIAVGNGNFVNGTDDLHTYVFLLDSDGKIRWSRSIGEYASATHVSWINNKEKDSLRVFVCEVGYPAGGRQHDSLFILNANNGEVVYRKQYGEFNSGYAVVRNAKGQQLIAIAGSDDTLRMLDSRLNLVRKCAAQGNGIICIRKGDFTGRKRDEIVIQTINDKLILFDTELNVLTQIPTGAISGFETLRAKNKNRLLVTMAQGDQLYWRLMEFHIVPILSRSVTVRTVISIALILTLIFSFTLVYSRYRQTRDIRIVIRQLTGQAGVIELNRKGDIIHTNARARDIAGKFGGNFKKLPTAGPLSTIIESAKTIAKEPGAKTVQETVISLTPEQTYLVRCFPIKKGALLTFEDISVVEYLKRVTTWAPVAQRLAHGIKNPLATILGAVEQMDIKCEKEEGVKKYIGLVKDEVAKLKKMSDAFMKFTKLSPPVLQDKNINELIKNIMKRNEPLCKGTGIKVDYDLRENLPLVSIDEEGITNVLNIIIENSIEAISPSPLSSPIKGEEIRKGGILKIRTSLAQKMEEQLVKEFVRIEISDTGKGIPEKYLNKVFDPYFTYDKPVGTGLGLTLAKKIVESHKGFIEIASKEGTSTAISIYLPLK